VGGDTRDHDERCDGDQYVEEAAEDDADHPVPGFRLSRNMDMGDLQGIAAATPVGLEQAVRSFGTAAAQLGEHELGAASSVPDEPVPLGPLTSTSAQVAGLAGNGSNRIVSPHTSEQPSGLSGNGGRNGLADYPPGRVRPLNAPILSAQGIAAWRRTRRAWRVDARSACSSLACLRA
jgi:hypothetical protein